MDNRIEHLVDPDNLLEDTIGQLYRDAKVNEQVLHLLLAKQEAHIECLRSMANLAATMSAVHCPDAAGSVGAEERTEEKAVPVSKNVNELVVQLVVPAAKTIKRAGLFHCVICRKEFRTYRGLCSHQGTHRKKEAYTCNYPSRSSGKFSCPKCGYRCHRLLQLEIHCKGCPGMWPNVSIRRSDF